MPRTSKPPANAERLRTEMEDVARRQFKYSGQPHPSRDRNRPAEWRHNDAVPVGKMDRAFAAALGDEIVKVHADRAAATNNPDSTQTSRLPHTSRNDDGVGGGRQARH